MPGQLPAIVGQHRHQPQGRNRWPVIAEAALVITNYGLGHVTYWATMTATGRPREEWPHRAVVGMARDSARVALIVCRHHGRYVALWCAWQVAAMLPARPRHTRSGRRIE